MSHTLSGAPAPAHSPYRWAWYLPGLIAAGWGFYGLLTASMGPEPLKWLAFFVVSILAHDLLLAPVAVTIGLLLTRIIPATLRAPAQVGFLGTGIVLLAGLPYMLGRGVSTDVPSALPFNYAGRVSVLVAVLWIAMLGWAVTRWARGASVPAPVPAEHDGDQSDVAG